MKSILILFLCRLNPFKCIFRKGLFNKLENVIAVISEQKIDLCEKKQFKKNEINGIIEFIINYNDK